MFKSLYNTLNAFGLVTGKYDRFYKMAQKVLKEERSFAHEIGPKQK